MTPRLVVAVLGIRSEAKRRSREAKRRSIALVLCWALSGCNEPPPCGLLSINSTVHCQDRPADYPAGYDRYPTPYQPAYERPAHG